ncbi:tetratricopeptide repeat protein [uncultured Porphyromonas sp.]|uniref:tetratricopeptide repeat protein n=1 Tax=uncultured Porphyromonas sp. TaxID=159274 RepID=UPI00262873B1|nr:tetratricopeptide repeat protein [uncultured Porphyromonas sp.]
MIEIPPGLREAIKADELVLFVGAGLSWNFKNKKNETLEGWTKMASSITSHLKEKRRITEEVKQSCDKKEPIDALKEIEDNGVNKGIVGSFVKDYFSLGEENDYSFQQKLFELSTKIITTNYDRAFEMAVPRLQEIKAYRGKDYELNRLKKDSIFLFKLHGCIEHIDSMVLFPSDYEKLYNSKGRDAEHALYALRNLIFNKTFLFIGTGLGDPQINSFFEEIKRIQGIYSQEHYIITPESLGESLDFLTPIKVDSYVNVPTVIDQLLEFKRVAEENKSSQEKLFLAQLKETEERNEVLTKELEKVTDENERLLLLLERESNNHLNIGLRHHLAAEYLDASEEYKCAIELNPRNYEAFSNWGVTLSLLAQTNFGFDIEKLCNEAIDKYQKAIKYKPGSTEIYNNWGNTLCLLARIKSGKDAEFFYNEAFEKYREAAMYKSDKHETYYNWGVALSLLAETKSGSDAERFYNEAIDKYQEAIKYKPDKHEAYYNWGLNLSSLAQQRSAIEAEKLYNEAIEKYREAIKYKPDYYEAFCNWGIALSDLAGTKSGLDAEKLYNEAIEKYREAVNYRPDHYGAYNNWGNALIYLAQIKSDSESENLYDEATEKYQQAIEYGGDSFYNLACLYVLRNRKEEALKYLDHALSRGEVSVEILESRWIWLRDDPDFKCLLSQHKGK